MYKLFSLFILSILFASWGSSQVIISDFQVNDPNQNTLGIGPTSIAVASNGNFAVAWQDWNEYGVGVPAMPRVAVQMFASNTSTIGPLNLFNGESRSAIIYLDDYLTGNIDLEFLPNGSLLVAVEHEGLFDNLATWVWSWEAGIGAVNSAGQVIDMLPGTGVIFWIWANDLTDNGNLRLDVSPGGSFIGTLNGPSYDTDYSAVLIQHFDANGNYVGNYYTPHSNDLGPNYNHTYPDIATNGTIHVVVWQDGREDANYDITIQFYTTSAPLGQNQKVNSGDPANTLNLFPSVSMNSAGNSVVVWADGRTGQNGEIFGQRFNASGQAVGSNFQISSGEGALPPYLRPEVAVREDGSFMVVWTDSIPGISGIQAYRARARQFDSNGNPNGPTFILPEINISSGYPCVATNGSHYYCSWVDVRIDNVTPNVFAKVVDDANNSIEPVTDDNNSSVCWLGDNHPNPFKNKTTIEFSIPYNAQVKLKVFDLSGKEIAVLANELLQQGSYQFEFNAFDLVGGVYFYRLEAKNPNNSTANYFTDTKKLILLE